MLWRFQGTSAEWGKGKGRGKEFCPGTGVRSRVLVALPVRKLGYLG